MNQGKFGVDAPPDMEMLKIMDLFLNYDVLEVLEEEIDLELLASLNPQDFPDAK